MIEILKKLSFDGVMYKSLVAPDHIKRLEAVALQLMPLENEIAKSRGGLIDIRSSGTWFVSTFDDETVDQLNHLLNKEA